MITLKNVIVNSLGALRSVMQKDDYYVGHDHLEPHNDPCYLYQFNDHLKAHNLSLCM